MIQQRCRARIAWGQNESLYDIATAYQIPLQALAEQNHLAPPYALAPGRVIELPPPRLHRVARGEDIEAIARGATMSISIRLHC